MESTNMYDGEKQGSIMLTKPFSTVYGVGEKLLRTASANASTVVGVGTAVVVGSSVLAIPIAPIALTAATAVTATAGTYSVTRSLIGIYNKSLHNDDLSLQNSEARIAYFNIVAASLGFVSIGATGALSYCASNGVAIGQVTRLVVNGINLANIGVSAGNLAYSSYQVLYDWINENKKPSLLVIGQLGTSILLFGSAIYNYRSAANIIETAQTNQLSSYSDSLRSNRHRKMLNKLTKETVRQHGDVTTAGAASISTLKNIENIDETFAILTRNNKLFNEHGIKFFSDAREIKLNGISVDLFDFGIMNKNQRTNLLLDLPTRPVPIFQFPTYG